MALGLLLLLMLLLDLASPAAAYVDDSDPCTALPPPSTASSCQIFASWNDFAAYLSSPSREAGDEVVLCAGSWLTRPAIDAGAVLGSAAAVGAEQAVVRRPLRLSCSVPGKCRVRGPGRHLTVDLDSGNAGSAYAGGSSSSADEGGLIEDVGTVVIDGIRFEGATDASLHVKDTDGIGNSASANVLLCGNAFLNNHQRGSSSSSGSGGAVYSAPRTDLTVGGGTLFQGNAAPVGGAIGFAGRRLRVVDAWFEGNVAEERGGAVAAMELEEDAEQAPGAGSEDGRMTSDSLDDYNDGTSAKLVVAASATAAPPVPQQQKIEIGSTTFVDNASHGDGNASGAIYLPSAGATGAGAASAGTSGTTGGGAGSDWIDLGGNELIFHTDGSHGTACMGAYTRSVPVGHDHCLHFLGAEVQDEDYVLLDPEPEPTIGDDSSLHDSSSHDSSLVAGTTYEAEVALALQEAAAEHEQLHEGTVQITGGDEGMQKPQPQPQPQPQQLGTVWGKGLYHHEDTDLHIAEGLTVRRFAKKYQPVTYTSANRRNLVDVSSGQCSFPTNPDGAATFYDPRHNVDGGFTYCINAESTESGGVSCVEFDADCHPMGFAKRIGGQLGDGCTEPSGGFVPNTRNCNGG